MSHAGPEAARQFGLFPGRSRSQKDATLLTEQGPSECHSEGLGQNKKLPWSVKNFLSVGLFRIDFARAAAEFPLTLQSMHQENHQVYFG